MRKNRTKLGGPARLKLYGKPGAAKFIGVSLPVIEKATTDGRLAFILDDSGKMLFTENAMRDFQRIYTPGNRNKRTYRAGKA